MGRWKAVTGDPVRCRTAEDFMDRGCLRLHIIVPQPDAGQRLQMYNTIMRGCTIADDAAACYLSDGPDSFPSAEVIEYCQRARECGPSLGHAAAP